MKPKVQDNLWRPKDEKGTHLFMQVPNCLIREIGIGVYSPTEVKVLLFIARMSFGFRRENTNQLSLDDFREALLISNPLASSTIKALLKDNHIFRHSKNGVRYVYAINMLPHGLKMKHYRIGKVDDKSDNGIYKIGNIDYELNNYKNSENNVILYSTNGYSNPKSSYIKEDIKIDRNMDKRTFASTPVSSVLSTNKPSSSPSLKLPAHKLLTNGELNAIVDTFINDIKKDYSVDIVLKHIKELDKKGIDHMEVIFYPFHQYCRRELKISHNVSTNNDNPYYQATSIFKKEKRLM